MRILVLFPFPMCYFLKWKKCFMEGLKCTSKFRIFNKLKTKIIWVFVFSSVQFSRSVVSNSLWPHGLQHARPPCASPTPGVHSNSRPLSQWCHPTISSSVIPFSSCLFPNISIFSNVSALRIRWPKYWSFSFNICLHLLLNNIFFICLTLIPELYLTTQFDFLRTGY